MQSIALGSGGIYAVGTNRNYAPCDAFVRQYDAGLTDEVTGFHFGTTGDDAAISVARRAVTCTSADT